MNLFKLFERQGMKLTSDTLDFGNVTPMVKGKSLVPPDPLPAIEDVDEENPRSKSNAEAINQILKVLEAHNLTES